MSVVLGTFISCTPSFTEPPCVDDAVWNDTLNLGNSYHRRHLLPGQKPDVRLRHGIHGLLKLWLDHAEPCSAAFFLGPLTSRSTVFKNDPSNLELRALHPEAHRHRTRRAHCHCHGTEHFNQSELLNTSHQGCRRTSKNTN